MANKYYDLVTQFARENNIDKRSFLDNTLIDIYYDIFILDNVDKYIDSDISEIINNIGMYYYLNKNYDYAIKYFLSAIEKNNDCAMNNLGDYYKNIKQNYPYAVHYYSMAIETNNNNSVALDKLSYYYQINNNYEYVLYYYEIYLKNVDYTNNTESESIVLILMSLFGICLLNLNNGELLFEYLKKYKKP